MKKFNQLNKENEEESPSGSGGAFSSLARELLDKEKSEEGAPVKERESKDVEKQEKKEEIHSNEKQDEEFDPVEFDEDKVVTKSGKPVGDKSKEVFRKFKDAAKKDREELALLREESKKLKEFNYKETDEFKNLQKERDEYRTTVDNEYFYESPQFKNTFLQPLKDAKEAVKKYTAEVKDKDELMPILEKMTRALQEKNEFNFDEAVDQAAEEHFSSSTARKFSRACQDLWDKNNSYVAALDDRIKAKEDIDKKRAEQTSKSGSEAYQYLDSSISAFTKSNSQIIDMFNSNEDLKKEFDYNESLKSETKKTKDAVDIFMSTGNVTQEFKDVLYRASILPARDQEVKVQARIIGDVMKQNDLLKKDLKEASDKILELSGKPSSRVKPFDQREKDNSSGSGGAFSSTLKRMINSNNE